MCFIYLQNALYIFQDALCIFYFQGVVGIIYFEHAGGLMLFEKAWYKVGCKRAGYIVYSENAWGVGEYKDVDNGGVGGL